MSLRSTSLALALLAATVGLSTAPREAQANGPRQYYSSWQHHPTQSFHFRKHYHKPTPNFNGYRHHYVVYYPQRPQHLYFYNPYKKQFWGRCPVSSNGKGEYSLLAEKDRKGSIDDIPESAFPALAAVPPVPGSSDSLPLDLLPDDLPDVSVPGLTLPAPPAE